MSTREDGFAMVFSAIVMLGLLLLGFGSIQISCGVGVGIQNYYVTLQAVQQMRLNTPNKQAALDAAAWIARLNGFSDAKALDTHQDLASGEAQFTYDSSIVPNHVSAYFKRDLTLLSGLLANIFPGIGLPALETEASAIGTSRNAFVSFHVDTSESMRGRDETGVTPSVIGTLLSMYGIPEYPPGTTAEACCYPIDIDNLLNRPSDNNACDALEKAICNRIRSFLPYYHGTKMPRPIWYRIDMPIPADTGMWFNQDKADSQEGTTFDYYNPSTDYSRFENKPIGDNLLICGSPLIGDPNNPIPWCIQNDSKRPCFPISPKGVIQQFDMNHPGWRSARDYMTYDRTTNTWCSFATAGDAACSSLEDAVEDVLIASGLDPAMAAPLAWVSDRSCRPPWQINRQWLTRDEEDQCQRGQDREDESLPEGGCSNQFAGLTATFSNAWLAYSKLTQAAMVALSDQVKLSFSTFSGPTGWGAIANLVDGTGERLGGNRIIFDANKKPGHIFQTEVDDVLLSLMETKVHTDPPTGPLITVPGNLGYQPGPVKTVGLLPHLDRSPGRFKFSNPDRNQEPFITFPFTADRYAYRGFKALSPVGHPSYSCLESGQSPPYTGRCGSWELNRDGFHPADWSFETGYTLFRGGDQWGADPDPSLFFPATKTMLEGVQPPIPWHDSWFKFISINGDQLEGAFDWHPLKAIDFETGRQDLVPKAYQDENVMTRAGEVFAAVKPTYGGTDHWSVVRDGRKQCLEMKGGPGEEQNPMPCVLLIVTDGLPNLEHCEEAKLPDDRLNCLKVFFPDHITEIKNEMDEYFTYKNSYVVVLFLLWNPDLVDEGNFKTFRDTIAPIERSDENRAFFLHFDVSDPTSSEFTEQYGKAIELATIITKGITLTQ